MAIAFLLWYSFNASNALGEKIESSEQEARMAEVAQSAFVQLTESPGDPSNWGDLGASSIGLAESKGVLDRGKVERFAALAGDSERYDGARAMLSFNRQGGAYLFNFKVSEISGSEIYSIGPKEPGASVALVSNVMAMDGRLVRASLRVWDIGEGTG